TQDKSSWEFVPSDICDSFCTGGNCCQAQKANCACALQSGAYGCACAPGYTGYGLNEQCSPCDIGYYKSVWGRQACDVCPMNSETKSNGATAESKCECSEGYKKNLQNQCEVVTCSVLTPSIGVIKVSSNCGNVLNDECRFKCATNYKTISGNAVRTCQPNSSWSGTPLQCSEILCKTLPNVEFGTLRCNSSKLSVSTECEVNCEEGYSISGDAIRTCELSGIWSGNTQTCEPLECPVIDLHQGGANMILTPSECLNSTLPYKSVCNISCVDGYGLIGPKSHVCQANQAWSKSKNITTECKDIEPPVITNCPQDIEADTDPSKDTAVVTWPSLIVNDNSGDKLTPREKRIPATTGQEFSIGTTLVKFLVKDAEKNKAYCNFNVNVIDREPPAVVSCPTDIEIESSQSTINVTWKEPEFKDNSGKFTLQSNKYSGYRFNQFEVLLVSYKVEDSSKNTAFCNFSVKVKPYSCPFQPPPANGAVAYDSWSGNQVYRIYCHAGYEFSRTPEKAYFCSDGKWVQPPPLNDTPVELPWPDCS
ncbi:sushi, von Willebrand factor type A, EGF and pentraxin domain-containing protein 1-like, partial [Anneissia japonica]|uniref:sushi, von Willebrand factor type A, EGF and pentraxin domain-containing protein 1-like n=1 Tax=Anneissia japonica TaxID=1529436 RepID=UPI00142584B7